MIILNKGMLNNPFEILSKTKINDAYHKYVQEGAKYVIVVIWDLYDLVYRKVFYIWGQGVMGNTEAALHSGIIPGNPDFNGSRRADVYCLPGDTYWRSHSIFGISFIMYLKSNVLSSRTGGSK